MKASKTGPIVALSGLGQPQWTPRCYDKFAEEGYQQNVIVHRSVNEISRGAAMVPLKLYKRQGQDQHPLEVHPLLELLKRPNPNQTGSSFMESIVAYMMIAGNSYVEAVKSEEGKPPSELHVLRPDRMKVVPGASGIPSGYTYSVNGSTTQFSVDGLSGQSDILHMKNFNPLNDWYGMSPIEAAAFSIDQHNAAGAHNQALLQNGARPVGALIYKPNEAHETLSDEQRELLKAQVEASYTGTDNAGKVMVLEGDFAWTEMGLRPRDMDFIEGKNTSARDIAQAFGVPPVLVGIPGDATYSNMAEARLALWEQTIIPTLDRVCDALNNWLVSSFGDDLKLTFDLDQVPALALRRQRVWDRIGNADFLTVDEKRAIVGYSPLKSESFE